MNRILILTCALAIPLFGAAAQCEGKTKAGERCKREAAEGSSYCIGHADQAKSKKDAKLKDDGTCWALTESGTRCKHKKDGDSDYCKQHAADKKPAKPVTQCRALTYAGTQCNRTPVDGGRYCKQHMGTTAKPQKSN